MAIHFGTVRPGSTLRIPFDTFAAASGAPTALTNFAVGDILIYKDGSTTERASTTGFTATTTFDSLTGINEAVVDLSSDATGDFFKSGSNYVVAISPVTADAQTLSFIAATFNIGYPSAVLNTSIATLSSQTSFTLTAGPAEDDALNGMWAIVHDKASAVQLTWVLILDYTGSTKTVTLAAAPVATFTIAAIDNFSVISPAPLQPTALGATLDVNATGEAGVDWANVGGKTTSNALTGTTIAVTQKVDVETIKTNPVVNGGTITFASNTTVANTAGAVGSVTGAVGSVTGNVGGNVTGTVGSVVGAVGSVTGNVGGNVTGSVGSLAAQAKLDVNAEADTALADYDAPTHTELTAELATADDAVLSAIAALNNIAAGAAMTLTAGERNAIADAARARALTEGYAADGAAPTLEQILFMIYGLLGNFAFAGTTQSIKGLDKTTEKMTFTIDSATTPTTHSRAT